MDMIQHNSDVVWTHVQCETITADVCGTSLDSFHNVPLKCAVLLHGWMGHREDLRFLAPPFLKMGYLVVAPDLPHHGEPRNEQILSCSEAAKLLSQGIPALLQCRQRKPLPLILVGYSMGGRIAFEIATLVREGQIRSIHVEAIILISSAVPPSNESERSSCRLVSQKRCEKLLDFSFSTKDYEEWLRNSWYAAELWGNIREKPFFGRLITERVCAFNESKRTGWALAAKHMCRSTMTSTSGPIRDPVLYFYGTCDRKYAAMAVQLQKLSLNFRCIPIQGAGHNILLDSPNALLKNIEDFLKNRSHSSSEFFTILSTVKFEAYSIPLTKPMVVGGRKVARREGLVVSLVANNNCMGVGDVCPLPGLHHEDIRRCVEEVRDLSSKLHALSNPFKLTSNQDLLEFFDFVKSYSPVSRNGFEAAFVQLLSQALGQSCSATITSCASHFLNKDLTTSDFVNINGVLPRTSNSTVPPVASPSDSQHRESMNVSPFEVVKLKVGACENIEDEIQTVRKAVSAAISSGKRIRLDANRAWTPSQYEQFETQLTEFAEWIDYIEEPLSTPEQLHQFIVAPLGQSATIPLALDESISDCSLEMIQDMASSATCRTLVLKPAVIGSLRNIFRLVSTANKCGCEIVFSSVFESGIGTAWTSVLASVLGSSQQHHGLGTYKHLLSDVTVPSFDEAVGQGDGRISSKKCEQFLAQAAETIFNK